MVMDPTRVTGGSRVTSIEPTTITSPNNNAPLMEGSATQSRAVLGELEPTQVPETRPRSVQYATHLEPTQVSKTRLRSDSGPHAPYLEPTQVPKTRPRSGEIGQGRPCRSPSCSP